MGLRKFLIVLKPKSICCLQTFKHRKNLSGGGLPCGSKIISITYDDIISVENLLAAWREFLKGKRKKKDVQEFERNLISNVLLLHAELAAQSYQHGGYKHFKISDPKPRDIHKAAVRDRLLHHALYRMLSPHLNRTFIQDSYSCRLRKGTHKAINEFRRSAYKASVNHTRTIWVLKCDIRKFFASVDQEVLRKILTRRIKDRQVPLLLDRVIQSFDSGIPGKGLPLGNLTSQLLVNVYMNELDQFVKHCLRAKHYIRYADDFVLLSPDPNWLRSCLQQISEFLEYELQLQLHPGKVSIKTFASGIDFLGWVHFPTHRVLRTTTKRRMLKRLQGEPAESTVNSYCGMLSHGNTHTLRSKNEILMSTPSAPIQNQAPFQQHALQ